MTGPDLNLLTALDVLLSEVSVARAARRLGLSSSAMSRTLSRLRTVTGDPLLVRAGRQMVLTPHAVNIRDRTRQTVHEACSVLSSTEADLDVKTLVAAFKLRANEGFVETFGHTLITTIASEAPGVCLSFMQKPEKDTRYLREGTIDLEIGELKNMGPEIQTRALFRDRFIGVVRKGHSLEHEKVITPQLYASCRHIVTSRRGAAEGPVDDELARAGLVRKVAAIVPDFNTSLVIARQSDLVALVPALFFAGKLLRDEVGPALHAFALPVTTPEIVVSQMWHPRLKTDPAHRWLRQTLLACCQSKVAELRQQAQKHIRVEKSRNSVFG
ncbi:MAG TPA: LysR family transcriptional regulator [Advenella sp.]|nr:LysR family transcriptional regulator [Advenella sp.]